jgi:hypothetical protein
VFLTLPRSTGLHDDSRALDRASTTAELQAAAGTQICRDEGGLAGRCRIEAGTRGMGLRGGSEVTVNCSRHHVQRVSSSPFPVGLASGNGAYASPHQVTRKTVNRRERGAFCKIDLIQTSCIDTLYMP